MTAPHSQRIVAAAGLLAVALATLLITGQLSAQGNLSGIDWDAARQEARSALSSRIGALVSLSQQDQDRIALPVLLPGREDLARNLRLSPMDNLYTAVFKDGTATISITGSRILGSTPAPPLGARSERIERTETGLDLNFSRFGAAYVISIECASPQRDPQCVNDDYALGLKNSLAVVMPRENGGPQ
jgi:hypothetical protein